MNLTMTLTAKRYKVIRLVVCLAAVNVVYGQRAAGIWPMAGNAAVCIALPDLRFQAVNKSGSIRLDGCAAAPSRIVFHRSNLAKALSIGFPIDPVVAFQLASHAKASARTEFAAGESKVLIPAVDAGLESLGVVSVLEHWVKLPRQTLGSDIEYSLERYISANSSAVLGGLLVVPVPGKAEVAGLFGGQCDTVSISHLIPPKSQVLEPMAMLMHLRGLVTILPDKAVKS